MLPKGQVKTLNYVKVSMPDKAMDILEKRG